MCAPQDRPTFKQILDSLEIMLNDGKITHYSLAYLWNEAPASVKLIFYTDTLREETDSFLKRKDEWMYVTSS